MIVRNNRIVLTAFLSLIMGFAGGTFTSCTDLAPTTTIQPPMMMIRRATTTIAQSDAMIIVAVILSGF